MARILIDVDGILFPFTRAFSSYLGDAFEEDDCLAWKVYPRSFEEKEIERALLKAHSKEAILEFGLYHGAREGVGALRKAGLEVVICTRREEETVEETKLALQELGLEFDGYLAGPDLDKVALARQEGAFALVDDKPSTIEKALAAGLVVFSLRWRYNAHLEGATFAKDWDELVPLILERA